MRIGDSIGRIRFLTIASFLNIPVVCFMLWVPYIWPRIIGMIFIGIIALRLPLCYIAVGEYIPNKWAAYSTSNLVSFEVLMAMILPAIYFGWISRHWEYWFYVFLAISIINPILMLFLPETPKNLYEK